MKEQYLIRITDKNNWLFPQTAIIPTALSLRNRGRLSCPREWTEGFALQLPHEKERGHGAAVMLHEHHEGYETFFVKSSSMYFYINGKKTLVEAGKIIHMQPYEAHGFVFNGDVQFRGTFHDWNCADKTPTPPRRWRPTIPTPRRTVNFSACFAAISTCICRGYADCQEVPWEEVTNVKDPKNPIARFELDGAVMKMITARWENGGKKEIWRIEMEPGFYAEWDEYPTVQDLFYVTEGKVKFKVYDTEFTAEKDCLVKIPKYAPRSFEAAEPAVMYDVGGVTRWYGLLQDFALKVCPGTAPARTHLTR